MKRLFFALWPDDATRQQCRKIIRRLHGHGRPVAAANLHVTLAFLGSVDEARQSAMSRAAAAIHVPPMALTFNRLLYWKKPAVVCLATEQVDFAVTNLVEQLTSAALGNEIAVDLRPYRPHVTLLRKAQALPQVEIKPIEWRADAFCLVESCSTPYGVEYRVLEQWPCVGCSAPDVLA